MPTIGEINEGSELCFFNVIEWSIKDFSSLSVEDALYSSPPFSFADGYWCLGMDPNGSRLFDSEGYIDLSLLGVFPDPPITVEYSLGVKTVGKKIDSEKHFSHVFDGTTSYNFQHKFLSRKELFERKSELFPSDTLVLVCRIKHPTCSEREGSANAEAVQCSCCNKTLDAHEDIQSHLRKCEDLPIKCRKCHDDVALKNWYDHKCQMTETEGDQVTETSGNDPVNKILQDFKQLFLKRENCDVVLRVKGKEFSAHKAILTARSPVFASTFQHNMKEKATGIVDIDDCDPSVFSDFLCFLYCREMDNFSEENVYSLYIVADKYDVPDLKIKCIDFIKANLSIKTFCDALRLALQFSEIDLTQFTTDFFIENAEKIITTVDWQTFVKEYPIQSNELFVKFVASLK